MEANAPAKAGIQVTIRYTANNQEAAVQVDRFPYLIGRDSSSVQLALPDAAVSRTHARLTCRDGEVLLENISTTNKTFLNGRYIDRPTALGAGDQALIGSCRLSFEIRPCAPEAGEPAHAEPPAPEDEEPAHAEPPAPKNGEPPAAAPRPMYCRQCGAKLGERSQFCPGCGRPVGRGGRGADPVRPEIPPEAPAGRRMRPAVLIIAAALVILLIAAAAAALLGGRSHTDVVKQCVGAALDGDAAKLWSLLPGELQDGAVDYLEERYGVSGAAEAKEVIQDELDDMLESFEDELGKGWKCSYEIVDERDYSHRELSALEEELEDEGIRGLELDAAKTVEVELLFEGRDEDYERTVPIRVVKIGRSWYLAGIDG